MLDVPEEIRDAAKKLCDDLIQAWLLHHSRDEASEIAVRALLAERERIAASLEQEADLTPCAEDAMVTRSNANLIRANFSYEDAERIAEATEQPERV